MSDGKTRHDGEIYHTRVQYQDSNHVIYLGEGYNLGDRFIRHGKGEEFWPNGSTKYDGDFMHDTASGKGMTFFEDETLCYEGEIKDMQFSGYGRLYYSNGKLEYEGEFVDGEYCGQGRLYDSYTGKLIREGAFPEESDESARIEDEWEETVEFEADKDSGFTDSLQQFAVLEEDTGDLFAPVSEQFPPELSKERWLVSCPDMHAGSRNLKALLRSVKGTFLNAQ